MCCIVVAKDATTRVLGYVNVLVDSLYLQAMSKGWVDFHRVAVHDLAPLSAVHGRARSFTHEGGERVLVVEVVVVVLRAFDMRVVEVPSGRHIYLSAQEREHL